MDIYDYLKRIDMNADQTKADTASIRELLGSVPTTPPSTEVVVKAGGNLQSALDAGGNIRMEAGAVFQGCFVMQKAGTRLFGGLGSKLAGNAGGPALFVPPGSRDVRGYDFMATTPWDQSVILLGLNDPVQSKPEDAPANLVFTNVIVPTHRGKRAFEINATNVALMQCSASDIYDGTGQKRDSQAIWVGNSPGEVNVQGGTYSAGSEVILIGGGGGTQAEKIVPRGLTFNGLTLMRPLSWQTDGVARAVKTTFEVKTGRDIKLTNATIDGIWKDAQVGYAITITPRNFGDIQDILVDTVTILHAGNGFNIIGADDEGYSPGVQRLKFTNVNCIIPDKKYGGGRFIQMGGQILGLEVVGCKFDGLDTIVTSYANKVWDDPSNSHMSYVSKGVKLTGNSFVSRSYGLMLEGAAGGGAYGKFWKEAWPDGVISANTFSGPTGVNHKPNLPVDNVFS